MEFNHARLPDSFGKAFLPRLDFLDKHRGILAHLGGALDLAHRNFHYSGSCALGHSAIWRNVSEVSSRTLPHRADLIRDYRALSVGQVAAAQFMDRTKERASPSAPSNPRVLGSMPSLQHA